MQSLYYSSLNHLAAPETVFMLQLGGNSSRSYRTSIESIPVCRWLIGVPGPFSRTCFMILTTRSPNYSLLIPSSIEPMYLFHPTTVQGGNRTWRGKTSPLSWPSPPEPLSPPPSCLQDTPGDQWGTTAPWQVHFWVTSATEPGALIRASPRSLRRWLEMWPLLQWLSRTRRCGTWVGVSGGLGRTGRQ